MERTGPGSWRDRSKEQGSSVSTEGWMVRAVAWGLVVMAAKTQSPDGMNGPEGKLERCRLRSWAQETFSRQLT